MKFTRKQLLQALGDCQNLFGAISSACSDRNPNKEAQVQGLCKLGGDFCIEVLSTEPPISGKLIRDYDRKDFV